MKAAWVRIACVFTLVSVWGFRYSMI